jgi:hypothetical protein
MTYWHTRAEAERLLCPEPKFRQCAGAACAAWVWAGFERRAVGEYPCTDCVGDDPECEKCGGTGKYTAYENAQVGGCGRRTLP